MTDKSAAEPTLSERELLAAEYVLGLAEGETLLRARALLARDPQFADTVARWEDHFAPLFDEWGERMPPGRVWTRIEEATRVGEETPVTADIITLRRSRDRWRMIGGFGMAAAAALAVVLVVSGPAMDRAEPQRPDMAAEPLLAANIPIGDTPLRLALTYVPGRDELSISSAGLTPDGVHDHELWLVDRQGNLHSLGVVIPGEEARVSVTPELAAEFVDGSELLLTREPLGGKPADADAGPVVAQGQFAAL